MICIEYVCFKETVNVVPVSLIFVCFSSIFLYFMIQKELSKYQGLSSPLNNEQIEAKWEAGNCIIHLLPICFSSNKIELCTNLSQILLERRCM